MSKRPEADELKAFLFQGPRYEAGPSRMVFQRTANGNVNRYKLLITKIVAESPLTVKMSNGSLLRKSRVAIMKSGYQNHRVKEEAGSDE